MRFISDSPSSTLALSVAVLTLVTAIGTAAAAPANPNCLSDLDANCHVGFSDVLTLIECWNTANPDCDLNDNGTVDFGDILVIFGNWGPCALSPDLIVPDDPSPPESTVPGTSFDVAYALGNVGNGVTFKEIVVDAHLSIDDQFDLEDLFLGSSTVPLDGEPLDPDSSLTEMLEDLVVPQGTATGAYWLILRADATDAQCEQDETNNVGLAILDVAGADLAIKSVTFSPNPVDAGDTATAFVTICNNGPAEVVTNLCIEGGAILDESMTRTIAPGEATYEIEFLVLAEEGGCGSPQTRPLTVSIDVDDEDPQNNSMGASLQVIRLYWDLDIEVSAPSCASVFAPVSYTVHVTNVGNMRSDAMANGLRTGICLNCSDFFCWEGNCIPCFPGGGIQFRNIPALDPSQGTSLFITYSTCNAFCNQTQFVKAGLNPCAGGEGIDPCPATHDFDCESIFVSCGGCD